MKKILTIFLCLLLSLSFCPEIALAQPIPKNFLVLIDVHDSTAFSFSKLLSGQHLPFAILRWFFPRRRTSSEAAPETTKPAGRRGPCQSLNQSFIALTPQYKNESGGSASTEFGFTTQVAPKAFVYLPEISNVSLPSESDHFLAQFMLQKLQNQNEVDVLEHPIEMTIPSGEGIATFDFNELGVTLFPDQTYHWYLSLICEPMRPARNPSVDAWIEVVDTYEGQSAQIQASAIKDPWKKVEFYAEEKGLWHEAMALLTELRCQEPNNAQYKDGLKELLTEILLLSTDDASETESEAVSIIKAEIKHNIEKAVEEQHCPIELSPV